MFLLKIECKLGHWPILAGFLSNSFHPSRYMTKMPDFHMTNFRNSKQQIIFCDEHEQICVHDKQIVWIASICTHNGLVHDENDVYSVHCTQMSYTILGQIVRLSENGTHLCFAVAAFNEMFPFLSSNYEISIVCIFQNHVWHLIWKINYLIFYYL